MLISVILDPTINMSIFTFVILFSLLYIEYLYCGLVSQNLHPQTRLSQDTQLPKSQYTQGTIGFLVKTLKSTPCFYSSFLVFFFLHITQCRILVNTYLRTRYLLASLSVTQTHQQHAVFTRIKLQTLSRHITTQILINLRNY